MADNADLARSLYDAWNRRDFDAQADATAADGKIHVVGSGDTYEGPDGSRKYNTMWADAFPDAAITVDRVIPAGDMVVVEFTGRGTHTARSGHPHGHHPRDGSVRHAAAL